MQSTGKTQGYVAWMGPLWKTSDTLKFEQALVIQRKSHWEQLVSAVRASFKRTWAAAVTPVSHKQVLFSWDY